MIYIKTITYNHGIQVRPREPLGGEAEAPVQLQQDHAPGPEVPQLPVREVQAEELPDHGARLRDVLRLRQHPGGEKCHELQVLLEHHSPRLLHIPVLHLHEQQALRADHHSLLREVQG